GARYLTEGEMLRRRSGGLRNVAVVVVACMLLLLPSWVGTFSAAALAEPVNLDLSSTARTLTPGNLANAGAININVGGTTKIVTPTTALTAAERLAAYQVFSTGQQSIVLGVQGNAVGGNFN